MLIINKLTLYPPQFTLLLPNILAENIFKANTALGLRVDCYVDKKKKTLISIKVGKSVILW